ncbi:ethanolamine permease [Nocardioides cavernae]|uniref:Ethanolamine permease n=1 Tax=Nocardioides cavernae TaxID=1921566 RepID=A0A7Y9GZ39_9ACTN|nr:amino acid permease [Nocardioides cavernae]NYE35000.1 ethanolamine permease [Nocardioides cavernae]
MSKESLNVSGVSYHHADDGYFDKRQLQRSAGFWGIWGIGIAAVISGDFSGWNFGLGEGGWGGLFVATLLIVVMYFGMLFSIGEMSAAMPHTGGAYSFARAAMGPWGGFVTGFAETIEYVATTGVVVYFSAGYADAVTDDLFGLSMPGWLWWIILYAVFVGLNSWGAEASFRFALVVAFISVGIIALFGILAIANGAVDFGNLLDIEPEAGNSTFLPFGVMGILYALPFAMWFFLGIEELPLAAEEAHDPTNDIPKAGIWGLVTLVACGAIVLFLNPAVTGSYAMSGLDGSDEAATGEPLLAGFRAFMPDGWAAVLSAFALIGLLASLQGIMYAYGRNMYSLSRAGYYPKFLSLTGDRKTPWVALLAGALIGYAALVAVDNVGGAGDIVLNIAVWGAVLAYMLQMVSFVLLRRKFPHASRPYVSPVGTAGAWVAFAIAGVTFVAVLINPTYRPAIITIVVLYALGLLAFGMYGRHRLVLSPEEEYAVSGGMHGDPEREGYGGAVEDELLSEDDRT